MKQDKICKAFLNKTSSSFGIKHRDMKGKVNNLRQIRLEDGMSCLKSLFGLLWLEASSIIGMKNKTLKNVYPNPRKEKKPFLMKTWIFLIV